MRFIAAAGVLALLIATQTPADAGGPMGVLPVTIVPSGPVRILGAKAVASRYGDITCVKFRNEGDLAAIEIQFAWTGLDQTGKAVAHFELDRRGTFAPGVLIAGPSKRFGGGASKNCTWSRRTAPATAFHDAASLRVRVASVTFADGTVWKAPSSGP